jgi:hypothetical protein
MMKADDSRRRLGPRLSGHACALPSDHRERGLHLENALTVGARDLVNLDDYGSATESTSDAPSTRTAFMIARPLLRLGRQAPFIE